MTTTWTTNTVGEFTMVDVPYAVWECGSKRPDVGESWLVFAKAEGDRLEIDHCDRSHEILPADTDLAALSNGCDPVIGISLDVFPAEVTVGQLFSVTIRSRGFILMDVEFLTDPEGAAVLDPPCPETCRGQYVGGNYVLTARAVTPGATNVWVDAFGEAVICMRGAGFFNWSYPRGAARVTIHPDASGSEPPRVWLPDLRR